MNNKKYVSSAEAFRALKEGRCIRHEGMLDDTYLTVLVDSIQYGSTHYTHLDDYSFTIDELTSTEWEIL